MTKIEAMIQLVASINQGGNVPPRLVVAVASKQLKEVYTARKQPKEVYEPELPGDDVMPPISKRVESTNATARRFDIMLGKNMGFGKHTHLQVEEVMRKFPAYLEWVHGNTGESFDPEILAALNLHEKPEQDEDPNPPEDFNIDRSDDEDVPF